MFVILGIIILIVSFVIALASLVAEQRKADFQQRAKEESEKEPDVQVSDQAKADSADLEISQRDSATRRLEEMVEAQKTEGEKSEPFPWLIGESPGSLQSDEHEPVDAVEEDSQLDEEASKTLDSKLAGTIYVRKAAKRENHGQD